MKNGKQNMRRLSRQIQNWEEDMNEKAVIFSLEGSRHEYTGQSRTARARIVRYKHNGAGDRDCFEVQMERVGAPQISYGYLFFEDKETLCMLSAMLDKFIADHGL